MQIVYKWVQQDKLVGTVSAELWFCRWLPRKDSKRDCYWCHIIFSCALMAGKECSYWQKHFSVLTLTVDTLLFSRNFISFCDTFNINNSPLTFLWLPITSAMWSEWRAIEAIHFNTTYLESFHHPGWRDCSSIPSTTSLSGQKLSFQHAIWIYRVWSLIQSQQLPGNCVSANISKKKSQIILAMYIVMVVWLNSPYITAYPSA